MVLASGHMSPRETFALVEETLAMGISKLVITHALSQWEKTGMENGKIR